MTQSEMSDVRALRAALEGAVVLPGDEDYETTRRVWNAAVDRRPALIARCSSAADVAATVRFAVEHGFEVAVRGGAHGVSGTAVVDDGLMIDLSPMNSVVVDAQRLRARVGGGALLADAVAATQEHALAFPVGLIGHTGVGGLTLGGGMGWLSRRHGLTIDNLASVEIVTADGKIRHASETEHEDLFWALRGGGGNFGVVTEFEFVLHPVDPVVQVALMFWGIDQGREVLGMARDLCHSLPLELNVVIAALNAPAAPFVPKEHHLRPGYALLVVGFGAQAQHESFLNRARAALPPRWEFVSPMPYVQLNQLLDEDNRWGQYYYDKGGQIAELTDEVIEVLTAHVPRKQSPGSVVLFYRVDGAYSAVGDDETAYSGARSPGWYAFIIAVCPTSDMLPAEREWVRELHTALLPHMVPRTYVNVGDETDSDVNTAYGTEKYMHLARIKAIYDPDNVFHRNVNIKPAPQRVA